MDWFAAPEYWLARKVLLHGVAAVYLIAFLAAARQFRALIGTHGMLPVPQFLARQSFRPTPSIFHLHYSDRFFAVVCWVGAALSAANLAGCDRSGAAVGGDAVVAGALGGSTCRSSTSGRCGTRSAGSPCCWRPGSSRSSSATTRPRRPCWCCGSLRWLLFRVEFGAGLIKLRGDRCWRDLTCLYYHHETQPMPGPLSWFFHRLPKPLHRVEVAGNHFAQLVVPFGLFAPQPVATAAASDHRGHPVVAGALGQLRLAELADDHPGLQCDRRDSAAAVLGAPTPPSTPTPADLVRRARSSPSPRWCWC